MQTENFTIIMQDDSDGEELESIEGNKLENVLVALKVRLYHCSADYRATLDIRQ